VSRFPAIGLALLLGAALPTAAARDVTIVVAERSAAYQEAAAAVSQQLAGRASVSVVQADAYAPAAGKEPSAIVALGTFALRAVLSGEPRAPVIASLIPRSAFEFELRQAPAPSSGRRVAAVFLDQPIARQLNLVRVVLPKRTRIGLLVSAATEDTARTLESAARERGLVVVREAIAGPDGVSPALSRLLGESDLVLALPDASIFNAGTIHNILLSALRARQPLIGFSEAYVRAGALAAVYSKPEQVGRQAGEMAASVLGGAALPASQYPRAFSVSVNPTVARALDIALEEGDAVAARLRQMEREP